MPQDKHQNEEFDRLDADAVCEECATVNPSGTLFCKSCGNNLRDQRVRRMAGGGEQPVVEEAAPRKSRHIISGSITLIALAAVLGLVINLDEVENWFVNSSLAAGEHTLAPSTLWSGRTAPIYEQLQSELAANPVSMDEIQAPPTPVGEDEDLSGRYYVKLRNAPNAPVAGYAIVGRVGDTYHVYGEVNGSELRGEGKYSGKLLSMPEAALRTQDGTVYTILGLAEYLGDGVFEILGQQYARAGEDTPQYVFYSYRVP